MNYDDQFLYKLIRRLQAQVDYVTSVATNVSITGGGGGGSGNVMEGADDPNTAHVVPSPANQPAVYNQIDADDKPVAQFWWHVDSQTWL